MKSTIRTALEAFADGDLEAAAEFFVRMATGDEHHQDVLRDLSVTRARLVRTAVEVHKSERAHAALSAFELVEQVAVQREHEGNVASDSAEGLERRLEELLEFDDLSGALKIAGELLTLVPDHPLAIAARENCRSKLLPMYLSKLGDLNQTPGVFSSPDQVIWLDLDHRAGFILSLIDGISSYNDIMAISGMDELESAAILARLKTEGVIGVSS